MGNTSIQIVRGGAPLISAECRTWKLNCPPRPSAEAALAFLSVLCEEARHLPNSSRTPAAKSKRHDLQVYGAGHVETEVGRVGLQERFCA